MMLRTTISRRRRVCSVAFISRILRGDQCSEAVSSAGIRRAHKTTKSTNDGKQATSEINHDLPDYTFSSATEFRIDEAFKSKIGEVGDKTANDNKQLILSARLPLTQRERCQRIIDQAFGNADTTQPERVLSEQYFSRTVNLEDTRREINESENAKLKLQQQKIHIDNPLLPDDRSQYTIFKMSREFDVKDDDQDEIVIMDSTSAREPDFAKNLENVKGTAEETPLVEEPNLSQAKEDFGKCINNPESIEKKAFCDDDAETIEMVKGERKLDLYQKATPTYQLHVPWFLNATTAREPNLTYAKEGIDECVNNPENLEKNNDVRKIKLVKNERKHDLYQGATKPNYQAHTPHVLKASTAKQDEELLTQKLETIEETPIVEAHKPKLEGFNVTPRVLGNGPTLNSKIIDSKEISPKVNLPGALDQVSKRCLNCPVEKIDEILINEMEKLGMTFRTAQKAPSTPMEDDLVQMDLINKQQNSTIEGQEIQSKSSELEAKENESATDPKIPDVTEQAEALRKSEKIAKPAEDILNPDHIRVQLKPQSCKSKEYNLTDDYNSTTKFTYYNEYLPSKPHQAAQLHKQEIEDTLPNSRAPTNKQFEETLSLDGPLLKAPLSETPNSHAFINNQITEPYAIQSSERNFISETAQKAQTASAVSEAEKTSAEGINTNVASSEPLNDASDNIRHEELLKPEYSCYFKGINIPSYNATMIESKSAGFKHRSPAERELDKNPFYSCNSADAYVWGGHRQNGSASKYSNVNPAFHKDTDEVELHGQTQIRQSTSEVQGEHEERQTTANRLFVKVPDKITQQCPNKLYSKEQSQPKPEHDSEKASLPEEILKQHKLDPYYVLTCNETCPISPGPAMSDCQNSDFVDTTETLYTKKNICDSVRPKLQSIMKRENMSSNTQAHPNDMEFEPETMPEIKATGMPEIKATGMPQIKATGMPEIKVTGILEIKATSMPEIKATGMPEIKAVGLPEINATGMPEIKAAGMPEIKATGTAEIEATGMPEIKATVMPEIKSTSIPGAIGSMPKLSEQVALSDLLRKVRERSRLAHCNAKSGLDVQAVGKCGSKAPHCLPTAPRSPPNEPVLPPSFGLPKLKRRPPICKPKRKPSNKIFCATQDRNNFPEMPYELNESEVCAVRSKVNLTDVVIGRLQNLGKVLGAVLPKPNVETFLVRDYEPWTPIPSWKIPQKVEKKDWQPWMRGVPPCVDGCPVFPKARTCMDQEPPCDLKPCEGFPKRRLFSMLDCFTVSLGKNKVYDLGDF